ncbi:MAG: SRPBCC domain-containing protein [Candidatus Acidiferrales bacterium]
MAATANTADREIAATRIYDAPRELVWKAWTQQEHITNWWGPNGFTTTTCEMEVRPGGAWRHGMHGPDGTEYPGGGVYREVVKPEILVFTNIATDKDGNLVFDGLTSVTFVKRNGKTILTLEARGLAMVAYSAAYLKGMEQGWTQSLERLAAFAAKP